MTPQSTPKKQSSQKDLILTPENSFLSTNMVKFSSDKQFETLKVYDRSQKERGAFSLKDVPHLGDVGNYNYEYSMDLYVKDKDLVKGATITWNRFKESCGDEVMKLAI